MTKFGGVPLVLLRVVFYVLFAWKAAMDDNEQLKKCDTEFCHVQPLSANLQHSGSGT